MTSAIQVVLFFKLYNLFTTVLTKSASNPFCNK